MCDGFAALIMGRLRHPPGLQRSDFTKIVLAILVRGAFAALIRAPFFNSFFSNIILKEGARYKFWKINKSLI
jgi:hypothetical protein